MINSNLKVLALIMLILPLSLYAQNILPPVLEWSGKSEKLLKEKNHPWITHFELSKGTESPDYKSTVEWFEKLATSSDLISIEVIGKSAQARDIIMVKLSGDKEFHQNTPSTSEKATLFAHAGIHSGEIDGKDAAMMLFRDIIHGDKEHLLEDVNVLFIPILNVDGHERRSKYSRVNQRGPVEMGWRTNARNLNLNRDFTKVETEGVKAVIEVMKKYNPHLYIDMHVTDGADYQYDLTFNFNKDANYSPQINKWLINSYQKQVNKQLSKMGHIPGPFINPANWKDFKDGVSDYGLGARFSNIYGDIRHIPSVLLENHSLKPYKQRVLGSYVFLEESIKTLSKGKAEIIKAIEVDKKSRKDSLVLKYASNQNSPSKIKLLGVKSVRDTSKISGAEYVKWLGEKESKILPYFVHNIAEKNINIPKKYYIPVEWYDIIEKLNIHGIVYETLEKDSILNLKFDYIKNYSLLKAPYEGMNYVKSYELEEIERKVSLKKGSVIISTDQDLWELAVFLLDSRSEDSFFAWGYFNSVLSRTEYIEGYVIEPLAEKMLQEDPELRKEFELKKKNEPEFAKTPRAIYSWFYSKSKYYDKNWNIIPVGKSY